MKLMGLLVSLVLLGAFAGCKWSCCSQCPCCQDHGKEEKLAAKESTGHVEDVVNITTVKDFDEKVLKATKPVIVDFSAPWCGACQMVKPTFHKLAHELSGKYMFVTVDVDAVGQLAQRYGIQGIPTFLLLKNGQKVGEPLVGALSEEAMINVLEKNFGK